MDSVKRQGRNPQRTPTVFEPRLPSARRSAPSAERSETPENASFARPRYCSYRRDVYYGGVVRIGGKKLHFVRKARSRPLDARVTHKKTQLKMFDADLC
eukprot:2944585-Pleurochrysis_carterae.AAC.1